MICRKCARIFDDSMSVCPDCGAAVFGDVRDTSAVKQERIVNVPYAVRPSAQSINGSLTASGRDSNRPVVITAASVNRKKQANGESVPVKTESNYSVAKKNASDGNEENNKKLKQGTGDKSAAILIVALVTVLSVMAVIMTVISAGSGIFKEDDEVRAMALSGLSGEQTGDLEEWISEHGYAFSENFEASCSGSAQVIRFFGIGKEKSFYTDMFGAAEKIQTEPDPAHRYKNEEGNYSYYRVEKAKAEAVLSLFSMESDPTLNCEDAYYFDGFYYFADTADDLTDGSYIADVSSSKKIQDGSFYIKYNLLDAETLSDEIGDRYAIVEKMSDEGNKWKVKKISSEPIFDAMGNLIREEAYQMKTETVEISAEDGTVYHRITVEYPFFDGESNGEKIINEMFVNTITNYREAGKNAVGVDYEHYISNGGKAEELPLVTSVTARVTRADSSYIGFLMEIAEYVPGSMPEKNDGTKTEELHENVQPEQEENEAPVELSQRRTEGYTVDVETGEFIGKDAVIGKDYQNISKLLYRIYGGYDYSDVVADIEKKVVTSDDDTQEADGEQNSDIPTDEKNIGEMIYDGAGALSDEGYVFFFVNEKGYSEKVVIPFEISVLFQGDFTNQSS